MKNIRDDIVITNIIVALVVVMLSFVVLELWQGHCLGTIALLNKLFVGLFTTNFTSICSRVEFMLARLA